MNWITTASRLVVLIALSAGLGWMYGYQREAVIFVLLMWIGVWVFQMRRLQEWLKNSDKPPPDAFGVWDEIYARIYSQQRKSSKEKAQLQSTVEYLQDSFAAMRDGVVMVDQHGAIQWLNRAVEPLLGLRYPEDTGQTLTNLVRAPEFNQYFLARDYRKPLQYHAVGENRSCYLRVDVTHFGEGERLLFIRDISAQVRLENMRRDFVANVSHELRTPLTVISGYLSTILDNSEELPQRYVRPLQQMDQQAQRMESLLKDLLWLSRIESEKRDDEREQVDIRALLQELRDELAEGYADGAIELNIETADKVFGDYRQIYSAVSNLVVNAIKYSTAGSPVTINWISQGNDLLLQVCDKGIGIDSTHIPRLTERFYRVDDSRNSETGGTGLGLAIVKHVAAAHGANLTIESKLGEGSTFTLVFPNNASIKP
tara:strand:- start:860 stop:2143 length:1284 start_codon:yes stop_codon:yes gene_type:complete